MSKIRNDKRREKAFQLWQTGEYTLVDLAKEIGVNPVTIGAWKKKYNWITRKEEIDKKTQEKVGEKLSDIRARQIRIAKAAQADYLTRIQMTQHKGSTTYHEADKAMKHELLSVGEATERTEENLNFTDIHKIYEKWEKTRNKSGQNG